MPSATVQLRCFDRRREVRGLPASSGRRSNLSHCTALCSLWAAARSDATQWVAIAVVAGAAKAMAVRAAATAAVAAPPVTEVEVVAAEVATVAAKTSVTSSYFA